MEIKNLKNILDQLGIEDVNYGVSDGENWFGNGKETEVLSPINGQVLAKVKQGNREDYDTIVEAGEKAFVAIVECLVRHRAVQSVQK